MVIDGGRVEGANLGLAIMEGGRDGVDFGGRGGVG